MQLLQNKKIVFGLGGIIVVAILGALWLWAKPTTQPPVAEYDTDSSAYSVVASAKDVVLMSDVGLNIEWLVDKDDGRRQIFSRYRPVLKSIFEQLTGNEFSIGSIDITREGGSSAFLTYPDGTREDVTGDNPFLLFSILPPQQVGEYILDIETSLGEAYKLPFTFIEPKEVSLIDTGNTRIEKKPDENKRGELTVKERLLLQALEVPEREQREVRAFKLGNLDLREAESVYHITPGNGAFGGREFDARDVVNIDEFFWLDTVLMAELQQGEHIFLALMPDGWYYSTMIYPDDFL